MAGEVSVIPIPYFAYVVSDEACDEGSITANLSANHTLLIVARQLLKGAATPIFLDFSTGNTVPLSPQDDAQNRDQATDLKLKSRALY